MDDVWHVLAEFTLHAQMGSKNFAKRSALAAIEALSRLHLPGVCLAELEGAVERAALNAVEHRDRLHPGLPVSWCIYTPEKADLHGIEKLTGTSRGWGYFFIEKLTESGSGEAHPVVLLYLYPEGNF
jgi:hypothetical protein